MSIRSVWVISFQNRSDGQLLFSRSFPTTEHRVKQTEGEHYIPLPANKDVAKYISQSLGLKSSSNLFVHAQDGCQKKNEKPVFEVETPLGKLWPLLIVEQFGLLYCCLPLVDGGSHLRPPLADILGLSSGFTLLVGMGEFTGQMSKNVDEYSEAWLHLHQYLNEAAPFGSVVEVNKAIVADAVRCSRMAVVKQELVQPFRRPKIDNHSPNQVTFRVQEYVKAILYDKANVEDTMQTYGKVQCLSELSGVSPQVSLNITLPEPDNLLFNPCVVQVDAKGSKVVSSSVKFSSPADKFVLCHYGVNNLSIPLSAVYNVKGETKVEILMEIKSKSSMSILEYCELQMPFYHRGNILNVDGKPSQGSLIVAKNTLVWNIGPRFGRSQETLTLKATLEFAEYKPDVDSGQDPFCVGNNCFANLLFKMKDHTVSGIKVDSKTVKVTPPAKAKISIGYETSCEYKIWNSQGDAAFSLPPPPALMQLLH